LAFTAIYLFNCRRAGGSRALWLVYSFVSSEYVAARGGTQSSTSVPSRRRLSEAMTVTLLRSLARSYRSQSTSLVSLESKFSTKTTGSSSRTTESALRDKLFENVDVPVPGAAASESAAGASEAVASGANRFLSFIGNALLYGVLAAGAGLGYVQYRYTTGELEAIIQKDEKEDAEHHDVSVVRKMWDVLARYYIDQRVYVETEMKKYADPPSDNLLPDLPPQASHIKTLVLDLDNVLIHSDWTRGRGWRTFKRPGADEFIQDLAQYFELVVYTSQLPTYADPILDRLDPHRMIQYRLYRDSTNYLDGKHVRDLSKLNRNLKQVLMITADADAYSLQPENAIKLKKWKTDDKEDTTLLDMMPFLEAIVRTNVPDVRAVVKSYEGEDIPKAFKERMSKVSQEKKNKSEKKKASRFAGFGPR
jgi:import inner membrane translocase subunit TIM50